MAGFHSDELTAVLTGACVEQKGRSRAFRQITIDSRSVKQGGLFIAIRGVNLDGHDFIPDAIARGARCLIVEHKIYRLCPPDVWVIRVADTTRALGELARAHRRRFHIPVIAITGSAGKTTTKEIIASVLGQRYGVLKNQGSFNNQWGVPLTLLQLSARHQAAVIEVGTNHPGEIAYLSGIVCPTIAVLMNIGPSHLEGFHSVENVYQEKRSMIDALAPGGTVVFNRDDVFLRRLCRIKRPHCSFGIHSNADFTASNIHQEKVFGLSFKINGRHRVVMKTLVREYIVNGLAAAVCGRLIGIPFREICAGLQAARFPHNRQCPQSVKGVTIINDSYNANPLSFRSSLNTLGSFPVKGKKILVCGDMLELGKDAVRLHRETGRLSAGFGIDHICAFGPLMKHFVKASSGNGKTEAVHYKSITVLNRWLSKNVQPGDVVLVKGSRGMRMERAVEFLKKYLEKR